MEAVVIKGEPAKETPAAPAGTSATQSGDLTQVKLTEGQPTPEIKKEGDRPAWLPEGFATPEELSKAYGELRTKMSKDGAPKVEDVKPVDATAAKAAVEDAGLLDTLTTEFMQNGKLSTESIAKMTAAGLNQATVDTFVAGQKALAAQLQTELVKAAGSEDKLGVLTSWARQNLPQAAIDAYNYAIDSGNIEAAKLALGGLVQQYNKANGTPPKLVTGGERTRTTGLEPFKSMDELIRAQSDPRYAEGDRAYIKGVMDRLRVSPL